MSDEVKAEEKAIKVVKLKHPLEFAGNKVTEIKFKRRIKTKDFYGLSDPLNWEDSIRVISSITDAPILLLDELDGEDTMRLIGVFQDFLGYSRPTGKSA